MGCLGIGTEGVALGLTICVCFRNWGLSVSVLGLEIFIGLRVQGLLS